MRRRVPEKHPNGYYYGRIAGKRINLGKNLRKATERLRELEDKLMGDKLRKTMPKQALIALGGNTTVHIKELAVRHLAWVKANTDKVTYWMTGK